MNNIDNNGWTLNPGVMTMADLRAVWAAPAKLMLSPAAYPVIKASAAAVDSIVAKGDAAYGINTGFGILAKTRIPDEKLEELQRNLILSHSVGTGELLSDGVVRLIMLMKIGSLARGFSGVRPLIIDTLIALYNAGIMPAIPAKGSVGASGDLAPLAHMTLAMLGVGQVRVDGKLVEAVDALNAAGIAPVVLAAKEGLALINGTQVSTAFALAGLFDAFANARAALVVSALSTDAIMGSTAPFLEEIHTLRGHRGQITAARAIRDLMAGSEIRESHRDGDTRVQDPYCIRCQPQVTGACIDLLWQVARTLEIESNAATDNPLVLVGADQIVSGGNFHAEPVAFAADQIALAVAEIGAIAQRRVALMVDPTLSHDLPPFLTPDPGLNSGLMIAEVTSAALMSENKHLATPCSTDSTPTSANQEDHVSMAAHGARRLRRMNANLSQIIGIEALCAAAGVEFRAPLKTSDTLNAVIARLRETVPPLEQDRYLAPDLAEAANLVREGELVGAVAPELLAEVRP